MQNVSGMIGILILAILMTGSGVGRPASGAGSGSRVSGDCDRTCLNGFVDEYLKALAAHDASRLHTTKDVKFTEDTAPLKLGDGLWQTITSVGKYRIYCDEPEAGEVGSIDVIEENGMPALMMLRLKVLGRRISEVETIVVRSQGEANEEESAHTDKLVDPDPLWSQDVPATSRPSRQEMIATVNKYFDGIVTTNGKMIPFASTGYRTLNGTADCNDAAGKGAQDFDRMPCPDQIDTGRFKYIGSITPRRFPVVDKQKGLVLALVRFNHPATVRSIHLTDGSVLDMSKNGDGWAEHPTSALVSELFKVEDGHIHRIWGVYTRMHYKNLVGWEGE
ncbi:MAG TPA: hypothetical protein VN682_24425 [Terriglobales bacterium]|nr:hypothetical protein [Terriglobales bacterium]